MPYTPGPWIANARPFRPYLVADVCGVFVTLCTPDTGGGPFPSVTTHGDREDNARLIAAAPDLLEALESLLDPEGHIWHGIFNGCTGECMAVRAAIAKARGYK